MSPIRRRAQARRFIAGSILLAITAAPPTQSAEPTAGQILDAAFSNRYDLDATAQIELRIQGRRGEPRRRVLEAASRRTDEVYQAIGQITYPDYLRGMTLLTVSKSEGRVDAFVYLPSLGKSRRITIAHRDDAFLGSDLTYQDFERRYIADCETSFADSERVDGEAAHVVSCVPTGSMKYTRADFVISKQDLAILEIREYGADGTALYRHMKAPRNSMVDIRGHILPTEIRFERPGVGTVTHVSMRYLRGQSLEPSLFTVGALERKADLERLLRRSHERPEIAD
jgi:hypothetical protein